MISVVTCISLSVLCFPSYAQTFDETTPCSDGLPSPCRSECIQVGTAGQVILDWCAAEYSLISLKTSGVCQFDEETGGHWVLCGGDELADLPPNAMTTNTMHQIPIKQCIYKSDGKVHNCYYELSAVGLHYV